MWAFIQWTLVCLFVPETYHPVLLRTRARKLRIETGNTRWQAPIERMKRSIPLVRNKFHTFHPCLALTLLQTILRSIYRPFMLLILKPMCLNLCIFSAILLGIQYLFFGAFHIIFRKTYGFELWQIGLSFPGISVGMLAAVATVFWYSYQESSGSSHSLSLAALELIITGRTRYMFVWSDSGKNKAETQGSQSPDISCLLLSSVRPLCRLDCSGLAGRREYFLALLSCKSCLWILTCYRYSMVHLIVPLIGSAFFGAGYGLVHALGAHSWPAASRMIPVFS